MKRYTIAYESSRIDIADRTEVSSGLPGSLISSGWPRQHEMQKFTVKVDIIAQKNTLTDTCIESHAYVYEQQGSTRKERKQVAACRCPTAMSAAVTKSSRLPRLRRAPPQSAP